MPQRSTTTKKEKRDHVMPPLRVSETEFSTIKDKAAKAGLSTSEFQRRACLSGRVVVQDTSVDVEAVRQLLAIGRNLNQITKSGHINKAVNEAELRRTLERINTALDGLL